MRDLADGASLAVLAEAARNVPGIVAAAIYELDSAGEMAKAIACAPPETCTRPHPEAAGGAAGGSWSLPDTVAIAAYLPFQEAVRTRTNLITTFRDVRDGFTQGSLPRRLLPPEERAIHLYPLAHAGHVGGIAVFVVVPERAGATLPGVLSALAAAAELLLCAASDLDQAARRSAGLDLVHQIAGAIVSRLDLDAVLARIATAAQTLLDADRAVVWLYREAEGVLERRAAAGRSSPPGVGFMGERIIVEDSVHGPAVLTGTSLFYSDARMDPRLTPSQRDYAVQRDLRSLYAVPLQFEGRVLGTIGVALAGPDPVGPEHTGLIATLANYAAIALHNAQVYAQVTEQAQELEALHRISRTVVSRLDPGAMLQEIADAARLALMADHVTLWLSHPAERMLELRAVSGGEAPGGQPVGWRIPAEGTFGLRLHQTRQPAVLTDRSEIPDAALTFHRQMQRDIGLRSVLIAPILHEEEPLGILGFGYKMERGFPASTLALAQTIANHTAAALAHARLYDQTERRAREMAALHRISRTVVSRLDMQAILQEIAEATREGLQADRVSLWRYDPAGDMVELQAVSGLGTLVEPPEAGGGPRLPAASTATSRVVHQRQPFIISDGELPPDASDHLRRQVQEHGLRSFCSIPIEHEDEVLGMLSLGYAAPHTFSEPVLALAQTIANHAAGAIAHARLYQDIVRRARELALLNAISSRLAQNLDLPIVLQSIAEAAFEMFKAGGVAIWALRENRLYPLTRIGLSASVQAPSIALTDHRRPPVVALQTRKTVFVRNLADSPDIPPGFRADLQASGVAATANVPLVYGDDVVGVLTLLFAQGPEFASENQALLEEMASHAAASIVNARKFQEVSTLAARDPLTGVLNHREFHVSLGDHLAVAERNHTPLSLIMLDVDDFKQVNDRYGHQQGDEVLREVALLLQREVRASDIVARYGGEEFAIILPGAHKDLAFRAAERICTTIAGRAFPNLAGDATTLTVSLGVATYPQDGLAPAELIAAADRALYAAKEGGKNRVSSAHDGGAPA